MTPSLPSSPVRGLLLAFGLSFSILSLAVAAPLDLGQKLTYVRLHHLPADLAQVATVWPSPALIVDLRYAVEEGTHAAGPGLPARARGEPLFVLVGPATPETAVVALRLVAPGLLTLGLPAPGIPPDIAVAVTPADDRRAYDALDSGVSIESLLSEKLAKQRFDEAALLHERAEVPSAADARVAAAPPVKPDHPAAAASSPAEPTDVVLLRAIQVHRALLALGKLPPN
jgi:hypothetical protein